MKKPMRVLITRPESEATALAVALAGRGHATVIAPLFHLQFLHPPAEFTAALASCQAVLLTSVNGARALAEASEQRSKPVFAVGDTTAATAEGLGFTNVVSAAGDSRALADLVREKLDPAKGLLLHASGVDVAGDLATALADFELRRFALYEAREADVLPDSARAALQARALDSVTFFSPRAAAVFVQLVDAAGLQDACRDVTAVAISAAAAQPLSGLPFRAVRTAVKPSRQGVLDEIDRLAEAGVQGQTSMSDTPSPAAEPAAPHLAQEPTPMVPSVRRGLGVIGVFFVAVIAAGLVLGAAVVSLPFWPQEARDLWRGAQVAPVAPSTPSTASAASPDARRAEAEARARAEAELKQLQAEVQARNKAVAEVETRRQAEDAARQKALEEAKRAMDLRLEDLEKRVRAAATTAAQADRPTSDATMAELRAKLEALESKRAANPDTDKELAALKADITALRTALTEAAARSSGGEQKAIAAARASAVIGIAARLSGALDSGLPFATDLALLVPFGQSDPRLAEIVARLQPLAASGVASRGSLATDFPAVAKAALADDLVDDSFGQRILGKIKAIVSLRRVGADVEGDGAEAKLARAEAALGTGDIAKAVTLVKSLPAQTSKATAKWLAAADMHLAAQQAVDQLAAHAVSLLGAARP